MKEITRIHIAKTAYDIEVDAKKDIQSYIDALARYASDQDILEDIEIRITELLAEQGVVAGGVITSSDITAVRTRLGEPSDFADGDVDTTAPAVESSEEPRRVYRDTDDAILGGVLSGIAKFFGIDPPWVRLLFVLILLGSFGTALVVYLILWLIIPPAETAAEKLRMSGRPVTLSSIKSFGAQAEPVVSESASVIRGVLRFVTGTMLVVCALAALAAVAVAIARFVFGLGGMSYGSFSGDVPFSETWWMVATVTLFVIAGVLLATLFAVLANAVFRGQWSRRTGTAVVTLIVAGLIAFFGGISTGWYGYSWMRGEYASSMVESSSVALPSSFANVKTLEIEGGEELFDVGVVYVVSDENRYQKESLRDSKFRVEVAVDGSTARISLNRDGEPGWSRGFLSESIVIYGPALDEIAAKNIRLDYRSDSPRSNLKGSFNAVEFSLRGSYDTVSIVNAGGGVVNVNEASISNLAVDNKGGLIEAGVVRTLSVTAPDACRASSDFGEPNIMVRVQAVSSGKFSFNGQQSAASSVSNDCARVVIGDEFEEDYL